MDSAMRGAGITEWAAKGVVGFERLRRMAQGHTALAKQAASTGKALGKATGVAGVALEAGNAAWLVADPDKRRRVEADYDANAKLSAPDRMIEGALNATDTLYATGKAAYDTGKTYESIERSQMDEINNSLLRKIAKHERQPLLDRLGVNPWSAKHEPAPVARAYRDPLTEPGELLKDTRERAFPTRHPMVKAEDKYPEVAPDPDTDKWFKANPHISGMAMGAGLNGSPKDEPRSVMVNPYSKLTKEGRAGLVLNEKLRHFMAESDYEPEFEPTPTQIKSFEGEEYGKPENRKYLKQTIAARILTGDASAGDVTPEQRAAALQMKRDFDNTHSNVVIIGHSETKDGPVYAIPTMVDGKQLSKKDAINLARSKGLENYHKDQTPQEHNAWAGANHGNIGEDGFLKRKPESLAESWMRAKAQQQRQQQEELNLSSNAKASLSAVMTFSRLGGRPTSTLNR